MTSPEERRREFPEDCVGVGEDERQGVVRINDPAARRKEAERSRNQSGPIPTGVPRPITSRARHH
ncbi:hypothetical protein BRD13_04050 [Halobacteriales archaeon SW_5_70_135]|nr:MAG: hypothetical protein BRD13_04050 [Halobacteriales archaeon SW_5_70_135]